MTTLVQPKSMRVSVNGLELRYFDWGNAGATPEVFATLEDAMAYRREISPVTASRPISDQRELALGVFRQRSDSRWVWKMDPAYIQQRVQHGAPPRPALWPVLRSLPCPTVVVWGTESDVLSGAQAARMVG